MLWGCCLYSPNCRERLFSETYPFGATLRRNPSANACSYTFRSIEDRDIVEV
jgi:hypothetical protein